MTRGFSGYVVYMATITETSESEAITTYRIKDVVWSGGTASCETVVITESNEYGRMLFLDGELQSASADERIYHESLVHPVLAATADTSRKRVLVIGGGEGATVREVLRWNPSFVAEVVWVDIDTKLVDLCRTHLGWAPHVYDNPRVRFIGKDIREVLPEFPCDHFDVVILDLPDPDGDTGYLYSAEFWKGIRRVMDSDGRLVTHVGPVRPSGIIGHGLQRIWADSGLSPSIGGFYSIVIPSFQGSWGFWMSGPSYSYTGHLPESLAVVDTEQLRQWVFPPLVWRRALEEQVKTGKGNGICKIYMPPNIVCDCVSYPDE